MFGWPRNPGNQYQGWDGGYEGGDQMYGGPGAKRVGPGGRMLNPAMGAKVGTQTNSADQISLSSRVFVGNLNTYIVNRDQVERMFAPYGRVAGISMHKGYAFVQYSNQFDARNAVQAMDTRVICGQVLDCNLVNEPKAHQKGRKRQMNNNGGAQKGGPANKKARVGNNPQKAVDEPEAFLCYMCKDKFTLSWDLLHHIQSNHNITLYEEVPVEQFQAQEGEQQEANGDQQQQAS